MSVLYVCWYSHRRERLSFVGINLDNILSETQEEVEKRERREYRRRERHREHRRERERERERRRRRSRRREIYSDVEEDDQEENLEEDYWMLKKRSRRKKKEISYKFEEYDELIDNAIHEGGIPEDYEEIGRHGFV